MHPASALMQRFRPVRGAVVRWQGAAMSQMRGRPQTDHRSGCLVSLPICLLSGAHLEERRCDSELNYIEPVGNI